MLKAIFNLACIMLLSWPFKVVAETGSLSLVGIISSDKNDEVAVIRDDASGRSYTLRKGERLKALNLQFLKVVQRKHVQVLWNGKTRLLSYAGQEASGDISQGAEKAVEPQLREEPLEELSAGDLVKISKLRPWKDQFKEGDVEWNPPDMKLPVKIPVDDMDE